MVILGLGSNIGDRLAYLRRAVLLLREVISDMKYSSILESAALLPEGAPEGWDKPFLNMALMGKTKLNPEELFDQIKQIELILGRTPGRNWAPREIDIDILAMGNGDYVSERLTIPHPGLFDRDFAMIPLAELAPDWVYKSKKASQIVKEKKMELGEYLVKTGLKLDV